MAIHCCSSAVAAYCRGACFVTSAERSHVSHVSHVSHDTCVHSSHAASVGSVIHCYLLFLAHLPLAARFSCIRLHWSGGWHSVLFYIHGNLKPDRPVTDTGRFSLFLLIITLNIYICLGL